MTLIGCPFLTVIIVIIVIGVIKLWLSNTKKCMTAIVFIKLPPIFLFQNQ